MAALTKNLGEILKWGGGILKVHEVKSDGNELAVPSTEFHNLGVIDDFGLDMTEKDATDIADETGDTVAHLDGLPVIKLTGMLLQTGKGVLDFMRDSVKGKYYQFYYKSTKTGEMNGKTQEIFGAIGRIVPQFSTKAKVKKTPFELTLLVNTTPVTIGAAVMSSTAYGSVNTLAATVDTGKYYTIIET